MIDEFVVYSAEEKSLCDLLVFYTSRRNWIKVIQIAVELIELGTLQKERKKELNANAGNITL